MKTIIEMAREAGFVIDEKAQQHQPNCIFHTYHMVDELLKRFAELVRADERADLYKEMNDPLVAMCKKMVAEEREACAKVCEEQDELRGHTPFHCAAAIRARGQA